MSRAVRPQRKIRNMSEKPDIFEWQEQKRIKHLKELSSYAFKKLMLFHGHKIVNVCSYRRRDGEILMNGECPNCTREIEAKVLYSAWTSNIDHFNIIIEKPFVREEFLLQEVEEKRIARGKINPSLVCAKFKTLL
jgi:hypothetical protein